MTTRKRSVGDTILHSVIVVLVGILLWYIVGGIREWVRITKTPALGAKPAMVFESAEWQKQVLRLGAGGKDIHRARMVEDLMAGKLKVGMKKMECVQLLGKPDQEDTKQIAYFLGDYPRNGTEGFVMSGWLVISLNGEQVGKMEIRRGD